MTSQLACPYQLVELIGRGQMGDVYLAYHTNLDRVEALKVLVEGLTMGDQFVARLRREARAASLLTHPHIVSVYGFGVLPDGRYYLAMEHLQGETLTQYLARRGAQEEPLALRFLYQLSSAIAHAHEQSVLHRDIKPSNMMIVAEEEALPNLKVLDFGLAKILNPNDVSAHGPSIIGSIPTTAGYVAPERAHGAPALPASDVYSFGCVAYHMVTGRPPFVGGVLTVLEAHQEQMPPPPSEMADISADFESIIMRCLAKKPAARYLDGTALKEALSAVSGFLGESTQRSVAIEDSAPETVVGQSPHKNRFPEVKTDITAPTTTAPSEPEDSSAFSQREGIYKLQLLKLAEELATAGYRPADLAAGIARISTTAKNLEHLEVSLRRLHAQGDAVFRDFRQKEAHIRFELGEIRFQFANASASPDLQAANTRISQLMKELIAAEDANAEDLQRIIDREVSLAAARHSLEEEERGHCASLEALIDLEACKSIRKRNLKVRLRAFEDARRMLWQQGR